MRVLIFGAGVIGTLYGYALSGAGHPVTVLVRPGREAAWADGIELRVLDARGVKHEVRERFRPDVVTGASAPRDFDLVVVAVKHTQGREAIEQVAAIRGEAAVLHLFNNWEGLGFARAAVPESELVFGAPRAGGAIFDGVLDGALHADIILGADPAGRERLDQVAGLFASAGIKAKLQQDMEHFYWVHLATTVAWIAGASKARGYRQFARSPRTVREALLAGRETLEVCRARGADPTAVEDARPFLGPPWLMTPITMLVLHTAMARRISQGHGAYAPAELAQICHDVVGTGHQLGVAMPTLDRLMPYVRELAQQPIAPSQSPEPPQSAAPIED